MQARLTGKAKKQAACGVRATEGFYAEKAKTVGDALSKIRRHDIGSETWRDAISSIPMSRRP